MARERLDVRKVREVLRLHFSGTTRNAIAEALHVGRNTVSDYLGRAVVAGITGYETVVALDDVDLDRRLGFFRPHLQQERREISRALPDFCKIHEELRRDG